MFTRFRYYTISPRKEDQTQSQFLRTFFSSVYDIAEQTYSLCHLGIPEVSLLSILSFLYYENFYVKYD